MVAGWLALQQVDLAQADRWLSEALDRYREIGDPARLSDTLGRLGPVALAQGDLDRARRIHTEEHEYALASGDPISLVIATANLGVVAAETGDLENAELLLTDAAAAHRTTTGPYPTAIVLNNLANVVLKRGDAARAAGLYRAALATFVEGEDWADVMACIDGLANATVNCWPAPTVHLLGAMAALRERLGYVRAPEGGPAHERTLETARAALGLASFAESWAVGQERPLDDVIAEALALATALSQSSTPNSNGSTRRLGLTPREVDVLGLVAGGSSNREIADALFISVPTVKRHLTNILGKLGVSSRTDAAAFARAHGLD
jgi:ATP/maltotriose-dependent transcriptional regulator MalT